MGIAVMFILLATLAPFLFLYLRKKVWASIQTLLLIGMWTYAFQAMFYSPPDIFTISWFMFYVSLLLAEVAWVMFIIHEIKSMDTKLNHSRHIS